MSWPILSVLVWLPIAGAIAVLLLGSGPRAQFGKHVALATSILTFVLSIPLYTGFDASTAAMQFVENVPWIRRFEAYYGLGVDGISMPLILLTTFLTPIVVIAGLAGDQAQTCAVFRVVPPARGHDDRRVRGDRRAAVLRLLGSDARADVHHHRRVGRGAARLRDDQVLPLHLPGLGVHAGRADLHVPQGGQLLDRRLSDAAARE
jgi:hypothetical protein